MLSSKRALYTQLVSEMIVTGPEDKSPEVEDHPLNPNPTSQWQSFFKDNEVYRKKQSYVILGNNFVCVLGSATN